MGHNIEFDISIVGAELHRLGLSFDKLTSINSIDSKLEATEYCAIPGGRGGRFKWPTLTEVHEKLFGVAFGDAHDAAYDVDATAKVFFELCKRGVITRPEIVDRDNINYESPDLEEANFVAQTEETTISTVKRCPLLKISQAYHFPIFIPTRNFQSYKQ